MQIDWLTRVITVYRADAFMTNLGGGIYEMDTDAFRLALKDVEDSEEGIPQPDTHRHNTEVTLGGVTYARFVEIINGYTITFENDQYAVKLVGSNNNISDVMNVNQVSLRSANSAGMVVTGSGLAPTVEEIRVEMDDNSTKLASIDRNAKLIPATL